MLAYERLTATPDGCLAAPQPRQNFGRSALQRWLPVGALPTVAWLLLADAACLVPQLHPVRSVIVLPLALLLPGWLLLRAAIPRRRARWEDAAVSLGLSLLLLMLGGLVIDALPGREPLSAGRVLALLNVIVVLGVLSRTARGAPCLDFRVLLSACSPFLLHRPGWQQLTGLVAAVLAVVLAAAGALRLNDGAGATLSLLALIGASIALVQLVASGDRPSPGVDAATVYLIAFAVLLMTSLRGAALSGHDVKTEFHVFLATTQTSHWRPGGFFSGYNSCLSITLLPTELLRLTGAAAADVFRVHLQLIAATAAPSAYAVGRRLGPRWVAALGSLLFVAFPTFINDWAMLNREEVAQVFFCLTLLAVVDRGWSPRQRHMIFVGAGAGMVLSHYTTTYIAIGIFALGAAGMTLTRLLQRLPWVKAGTHAFDCNSILSWRLILPLAAFALTWVALNGTLGGLTGVFSGPTRTSATADASLPSAASTLGRYAHQQEARYADILAKNPPVAAAHATVCLPTMLPTETARLTGAGRAIQAVGLSPGELVGGLRQLCVVLFALGPLAACAYAWRRWRHEPRWQELAALSSACVVVSGAAWVLPSLSQSYSPLRLYEQEAVLFTPLMALAITAVAVRWLGLRAGAAVACGIAVSAFAVLSGLVPQVLGGYGAQLNLNNAGAYYRAYYVDHDQLNATRWLRDHASAKALVTTDLAGAGTIREETRLTPVEGLFAQQVPADSLVLANLNGRGRVRAVGIYGDDIVSYSFPASCFGVRPVLFRSGSQAVLGPARQVGT